MATFGIDYTNCPVFLYCENGENLCRTTITEYDKDSKLIQLAEYPDDLDIGDSCRLLIMTEPSPREYRGRVRTDYSGKAIALFSGREKEDRGATRYKVNIVARIEYMIREGKAHALQEPIEIQLINISTTGMRFFAPLKVLQNGDRFQTRVSISNEAKLLIAEIVNHRENESDFAEYGCRFLIAS